MLLFACDAWLLRGRLAVVSRQLAEAKQFRADRHKPWDPLLAPLRAAEKTYHEKRDAYLRKEAEA
jgi:hypothetical protein